jgi:putative spermidine/putrescine transport system permease protein
VDEVRRRRGISPFAAIVLVLAAAYFLIPLIATFLFSLDSVQTGNCCSLAAWGTVFHDGMFWSTLKTSLILALETIAISLLLFVPTVYWVHLKLPRLRGLMASLALLPFVIPPIVLVVGLLNVYHSAPGWFYNEPYGFLVGAYVILAFPYMYFSLDAGFRAIDVHTLTEASHSLGAGWLRTITRVILPNIRVAALSGSFLALAIVMGEFTIASLASFSTFPTYIDYIEQTEAYPAAAVSCLSFALTWAAMLSLLLVGRGRPGRFNQLAAGGARRI